MTMPACSIMATRNCPRSYGADGCGDRLCARFETDDETPWHEPVDLVEAHRLGEQERAQPEAERKFVCRVHLSTLCWHEPEQPEAHVIIAHPEDLKDV